MMKIFNNITIKGKTLLIKKTLILSDLHIGQDESFNANGFLIPRFQYQDLFKETQKIIKETKPEVVVLNGDIKHEFSGILREEWKRIKEYTDYIKRKSQLIIIKGNHDAILKPLADKQGITMKDYHVVEDTFICHGDKIFDNEDFNKSKKIIIGHEHPAITLREGVRTEKYKCFLIGKHQKKELIVMPSMNTTSEGSDILQEKLLSPYLKNNKDIMKFKAIIIEGNNAYDFGELRKINKNKL